ncbi:MAG: type IV pilus assembly protein PilM [Thermoleophilia bacterium]
MARSATRIGLDLEQTSIAAVQVRATKTTQVLTAAAVRSLPDGLMFEGEVIDVDGLAQQLKAFWKESGLSGKRFHLGLANQKIVVRTMTFPQIDEKELRAAVEFQAQEAIPIPVEEAILDYQVLATVAGEDGVMRQKILLVAAQRDMISQFVEVAKKAGLGIDGIDLQAFALSRALGTSVAFIDQGAPTDGAEAIALVNIGAGISNLVVTVNGIPQFTRVINLGCGALTEVLIKARNISHEEAEVLRTTVGLSGDGDDSFTDIEPETVKATRDALDAAWEAFSDEIRRSIDYYHTQEHEGSITKLRITGNGSLTRNVAFSLSQALHLPVEQGDPLSRVGENKSKLTPAELQALAPRLAIALGLALDDEE